MTPPAWWSEALRECQNPALSLTAKGMGWLLSTYADSYGEGIRPSTETIARGASIRSRCRVKPHVDKLLDHGWIARTGSMQDGRHVYALAVPEACDQNSACPHLAYAQKGSQTSY
jgi:hypothetical protein